MITVNGTEIKPERFPDGTYLLSVPENKRSDEHNILFRWVYQSNEEMILLYMLSKHYRNSGHDVQYLDMPYVPNARMDRTQTGKEVFTLKYFCDFINDLKFTEVWVFDPHSSVTPALLNNCRTFGPEGHIYALMERLTDKNLVSHLFFPDEGAVKRYAKSTKFPYLYGEKIRDFATGKIKSLKVINQSETPVKGVLIVDDLCSYGGTFVLAAKCLSELSISNIYLYVSHCEQSIVAGKIPEDVNIKHVYIGSESMYDNSNPKITYVNKD